MKAVVPAIVAWMLVTLASCGGPSRPQSSVWGGVGMDEKPGALVPMDGRFVNDQGTATSLRALARAPVILALVYYHCPDSCTLLTQGMAEVLASIGGKPGVDYEAVSVSFDPAETPVMAAKQKDIAMQIVGAGFPKSAWQFLTGDAASLEELTGAVGFHYVAEGDDYMHPLGLIILSPQGKITRYLSGTSFLPVELKMSLLEASSGIVRPTVARFVRFCFSYNAQSHQMVFDVLKVTAIVTLALAATFVLYLLARSGKRRTAQGAH